MDPETLALVVLAEQLAALLAKTIVDIKSVVAGANSKPTAELLDDADKTWSEIIVNAKGLLPPTSMSA